MADGAASKAYTQLHHFRIFLDEHGCHELFAQAFSVVESEGSGLVKHIFPSACAREAGKSRGLPVQAENSGCELQAWESTPNPLYHHRFLERETRLELATSTLARLRSTN